MTESRDIDKIPVSTLLPPPVLSNLSVTHTNRQNKHNLCTHVKHLIRMAGHRVKLLSHAAHYARAVCVRGPPCALRAAERFGSYNLIVWEIPVSHPRAAQTKPLKLYFGGFSFRRRGNGSETKLLVWLVRESESWREVKKDPSSKGPGSLPAVCISTQILLAGHSFASGIFNRQ